MRQKLFKEAKAQMVVAFIDAGHISLADLARDELLPLHRLFLDTQSLLKQYCRGRTHEQALRASFRKRLLSFKIQVDKAKQGFENFTQDDLPSSAELLALHFATREESDRVEIVELLTTLNMLHLWHVPPHIDTEAKMLETNDDAEDSSTAGAPTEGDSNLETALKVGLADADRKIKAIQDA